MSNLCNNCNVNIKITANTFLTECSHCLQLICQDCNDIPIKIAKVIQRNSDRCNLEIYKLQIELHTT